MGHSSSVLSFIIKRISKEEKQQSLPDLLDTVHLYTGFKFMAVCSGGAALCSPSDPTAATSEELQNEYRNDFSVSLRWCVGMFVW